MRLAGHDFLESIVRPTGPGSYTAWSSIDPTLSGPSALANWQIAGRETIDPASPGDILITPFLDPPGQRDLYIVGASRFAEHVIQNVEVSFWAFAFALGPPPVIPTVRAMIKVAGQELFGDDKIMTGSPVLHTTMFSGPFVVPFAAQNGEWLEIGQQHNLGDLATFVLQTYAKISRRQERMPGPRWF